jgi:hypothetical protein
MKRSVQLSKNSSIGVSLFMLLFLLLYPSTWAQKNTNPDPKVDKEFPLMAWDYVDDEKTLQEMRECGVNLVAFAPASLLDVAEKYNIKCILYDAGVLHAFDAPFNATIANSKLEELIRKYNDHPALYGYHLKDEPGVADFSELGKSVELVKKQAPGKWPYINLLPTQSYGDAYESYLEKFAQICKPTAFSYDNYSEDYAPEAGTNSLFWKNLAQVRNAAHRHDLPFWNIILTAPHFNYSELTAADLRLRVYGSLVYGARGLSYYKFISASLPILEAPDLGNFRMAPIDQFGRRTSTWDLLRNINSQVESIGSTLLKLHSDNVYHIGVVPDENVGPTDNTLVKDVPGGDFIVGDFTHEDGSRYVMIVNKSLTNSTPCNPVFNNPPKEILMLSSWNGKYEKYPTPWYWLAPGQGVLLKLE